MHVSTAVVGVVIGAYGMWMAVQALLTGSVNLVLFRPLKNWGPFFSTDFERERHPLAYWATTSMYGMGGIFLVALFGRAALH